MLIATITMNCSQPQSSETILANSDTELALGVEGMVCAVGCAKFIEKTVAELDGVSACNVDFENGIAQVSYAASVLSEEEIIQAINELNDGQYKVNEIEIKKTQKKSSSPRGNKNEDPDESEVNFNFPQLVTYFISRIGR